MPKETIKVEVDDAFKDRIIKVMPIGHVHIAEDLEHASGQEIDRIGLRYGVIRYGILDTEITPEMAAQEMDRAATVIEAEDCDGHTAFVRSRITKMYRMAAKALRQDKK